MGGQGIERREILRYIGIASVAATFPGFKQWTFACAHAPSASDQSATSSYKPLFFSSDHYKLIEQISEMIIPEDDTPGAKQAGVAEFIDFMVANRVPVSPNGEIRSTADAIHQGDDAQVRFLSGLDWMDVRSTQEFGKKFLQCTSEQQTSLLEEIAYKEKFKPAGGTGRDFFQLIRDYTVVGYYTSKVGLESIGYPGLRTVWPKLPGCTHHDDPEHAHLTVPANMAGD
jgi:gluconate 2-dehydrogenase gamma chain